MNLLTPLSKAIFKVEHTKTTWAKSWFNVKKRLENMMEHFIGLDNFNAICKAENITEESALDTLVDFLNDLGVILHFRDFDLLDTHVIEPRWVTEEVYKIINSEEIKKKNGVLELSSLRQILRRRRNDVYSYPSSQHNYLVNLMKKFELCYPLDNDAVLIPDLLQVPEPQIEFNYDTALKFIIEYDFFPKSIMPRFIVKMHKDIKDGLQWRTGVVLGDKAFKSSAVIKADEKDKKIYIYVDGKLKRDYFSVIRHAYLAINKGFEKLNYKELVPCNCDECQANDDPRLHEYNTLIKYTQKSIKEFPCPSSAETVLC